VALDCGGPGTAEEPVTKTQSSEKKNHGNKNSLKTELEKTGKIEEDRIKKHQHP
jgi:hypothetical protein